jgi:hypothetical protein
MWSDFGVGEFVRDFFILGSFSSLNFNYLTSKKWNPLFQTLPRFRTSSFIEKLSALVPKPRVHLIRYAGAFARHAKIRPDVLVKARMGDAATQDGAAAENKAPSEKSRSWGRLLRKVFGIDVESCHACGGKNVKIVAAIMEKKAIEKILSHVGLPPDIPEIMEARAPPQAFFEW